MFVVILGPARLPPEIIHKTNLTLLKLRLCWCPEPAPPSPQTAGVEHSGGDSMERVNIDTLRAPSYSDFVLRTSIKCFPEIQELYVAGSECSAVCYCSSALHCKHKQSPQCPSVPISHWSVLIIIRLPLLSLHSLSSTPPPTQESVWLLIDDHPR